MYVYRFDSIAELALTPVPLWSRRCGLVGVAKHALSPLFPPPAPHPFKARLKGWSGDCREAFALGNREDVPKGALLWGEA